MAEAEALVIIPKVDAKATECVLDMRPLVLCKDCKHLEHLWHMDEINGKECYVCRKHTFTGMRNPIWFCADGERKEGR